MARKYRTTLKSEAERIADKYVGKKGGKPKPDKAETPDPDRRMDASDLVRQ